VTNNTGLVQTHKLHGRITLLYDLRDDLRKGGRRILLRGPSGIGKSGLLRGLASAVEVKHDGFLALYHEVESPAHSLDSLLADCTAQLLSQAELAGISWSDIGGALTRTAREQAWSFAAAALLDLAGHLAPQTKKLSEAVIKGISNGLSATAAQGAADHILESGRNTNRGWPCRNCGSPLGVAVSPNTAEPREIGIRTYSPASCCWLELRLSQAFQGVFSSTGSTLHRTPSAQPP
jgi:hypothetical protein